METQITRKERWAFGLAGLGQNMVYNYTTAYIMVFYTDVALIAPIAVGTLMLVARVFDAINDPILGNYIDRHPSPKGKLIPYLKAIPIPMFVISVLVYFVPDMSPALRLLYAYVSFILWDLMYTVSDVPYWGLSVTITADPKERLSLISLARILCNVGLAVSIVLPPLLIKLWGGGQQAYLLTAVLMASVGSLLFSLVGRHAKERIQANNQEPSSFKNLLQNKALVILQSSRILQAFRMVIATAGLYFAKYNLQDEAQFSLLGGLLILAMILAMFVTPKLKQHFTKKTLYQASLVLGFFAHITLYFLGYQNAWVNYAFLFIMGLSLGLNDVLTYTMVGDCVDAYEQKSGLRTEGLSFAFHTFTTKLQSAFGLFFIGFLLDQSGFIENSLQQPKTMAAIFSLITLYPAIASLLGMIPMAWYDIKEKRTQ